MKVYALAMFVNGETIPESQINWLGTKRTKNGLSFTGESYELNAEELSMYHFIIKLENTRLSKKNSARLCNALIWFVENNADAYNALLYKED